MSARITTRLAGWTALALAGTAAAQTAPNDTASPAPNAAHADHAGHTAAPAAAPTEGRSAGHTAMDHSSMDHGSMDHSGMDHSGMDHSSMDHSSTDHSSMDHSGMDHSGMDHGGMDHGGMDHSSMDHSSMDHSGMDHSGMDHSGMDHSSMDHSGTDHSGTDHGGMDHSGRSTGAGPDLPPITPAMRAAAFPDLGGMSMSEHMRADPLVGMVLLDRLEAQPGDGPTPLAWDLRAWLGHDAHRVWLRSEGERVAGHTEHGDLSLLWGQPLTPWWDVVAGLRSDLGDGPARQWAAFGVQGMAPYKFEVEATAYLGEGGRLAARFEAEYEVLLTQRLILQPRLEANLYSRSDAARGVGAGLDDLEAGVRLRYELRREIAPYVGLEQVHRFGRSADLARAAGDPSRETRWVAGLRLWW